jgi:hypothetical protein
MRIENVQNSENQPLNDMFEIVVTAYYDDFGQTGEVKANTVRYARLYATTNTPGSNQPQPQPTAPR